MRILLDENMPQITAALLREKGHEVYRQNDSAADREVLAMARVQGSLLVTYDKDFGELMFRDAELRPYGIILIRWTEIKPVDLANKIEIILREESIAGKFTVLTKRGIRQRPL